MAMDRCGKGRLEQSFATLIIHPEYRVTESMVIDMVRKFLKRTLLVACVLAALPSASFAQSLDLSIDRDGPRIEYRDGERRYHERRRGCSERQAIRVARYFGMRDPAIQSVTRRSIVVDGIGRRGEFTALRLANREGCPRIG